MKSYHYDGHGINDSTGQRIFTAQRTHANDGGGYVLPDSEREEVGKMFAAAPAMKAALELLLQAVEQNRFPTRDEWNIARQSIQPAGAVVHANKCEALALSFELLNNSDVRHFISTKLGEQARLHKALNALNKVVR